MVSPPSYVHPDRITCLSPWDSYRYAQGYDWQTAVDSLRYQPQLSRARTYEEIKDDYNRLFVDEAHCSNHGSIVARYSRTKKLLEDLLEKNRMAEARILLVGGKQVWSGQGVEWVADANVFG
ncbi:hypothetical protein OCU04_000736 [Sclerotinia nivalis]|uniref:Uncharacterized protein n=1 Tax=Sclerotinia nivalis TaxID=352851 RepID=A0A9X0AWR7_9HELO|nr:hypothetical protein OCU04_000736 [Sclerotinia nivalis]